MSSSRDLRATSGAPQGAPAPDRPTSELPEWFPIEGAPRDGSVIWLRSPLYEPSQQFAWERDRWRTTVFAVAASYEGWWDEDAEQPTEWRPCVSTVTAQAAKTGRAPSSTPDVSDKVPGRTT